MCVCGSPTETKLVLKKSPSFAEFVCLIALMMAVTAFSIDNLLPAFDVIRREFRLANPNDAQLLVYTYLMAFGLAQMVYGPLSDMYGRRPILLIGMAIFTAGSLLAIVAPTFEVLIAARIVQGIGSAAGRALAVAIVRDLYRGSDMARVMSLAMMAFLIAPVIAPAIGSGLLSVGTWHLIFGAMLTIGVVMGVWFTLRMPETLHPEFRMTPSLAHIGRAIMTTMTTRLAFGYSTAVGMLLGCVMGYVGSAQQILETDGLRPRSRSSRSTSPRSPPCRLPPRWSTRASCAASACAASPISAPAVSPSSGC